ncbi:MAG: S8 family peptidase [Actinomycetota bacterium]
MRTRSYLRPLGAVAVLALLAVPLLAGGGVAGAAPRLPAAFDPEILSPRSSGRAIVGFDHRVTGATIARLSRAGIRRAVVLDTIDAVGLAGPVDSYKRVAAWDDVAYVDSDSPITWLNYAAKKDTNVTDVRRGRRPLRRKFNGKGVTVAVVDTGVEAVHQDLDDRVVRHVNFEPAWFFDSINDGKYSDQAAEGTGNPVDSYGHGTHVAGIVAGTGEAADSKADMSGVAPGAKLVNIKIADVHQGVTCSIPCDFGWEMNALVAYEWVIEHRNAKAFPGGIRIATNSWSIYEVDSEAEPITMIVKAAYRKGLVNVFAAGNDGPKRNTVAPGPNSIEQSITVAAACKSVDSCGKDKIAEFSSRGRKVDIAAPGDNVYSTVARASVLWPIGSHEPPGGPADVPDYTGFSGTSMATPHVAGIVALMLDANPKLTPRRVERVLTRTAMDKGPSGFDIAWGHGLANAYRAVVRAQRLRLP